MSTQITIADEQLAASLNAAMIEALSEETRRQLVERSIAAMLERPETSNYGQKEEHPSKLEHAFDKAIERHVRQMLFEDEEGVLVKAIREQLDELVKRTLLDAVENTPSLRNAVVGALADALKYHRDD